MIKKSFPLRVLAISFLLIALPLLIDSFLYFQHWYEKAIAEAKNDLRESASYRAFAVLELEPVKQIMGKELIEFLNLPETFSSLPNEDINQQLEQLAALDNEYKVMILGPEREGEYKILAASDPAQVGQTFLSYFQLQKVMDQGQGDFFRYVYSPQEKKYIPTLFLARTIPSADGKEIQGIFVITADTTDAIQEMIVKGGGGGEPINFALISMDGVIFAATDPKLEQNLLRPISPLRRKEIERTEQFGEQTLSQEPLSIIHQKNSPFFRFIFDGNVEIAYIASIPYAGISVMAYSNQEKIFGGAVRHFTFIYLTYGLILIFGGAMTFWVSQWIGRPFRQLSNVMKEVSEGNLDVRFKKERLGFEFNILGGIFNQTLDTILEQMQKAEDEKVMKETLDRELQIGRNVQKNLLREVFPKIEGVEFAAHYFAANDVGGDFYDVLGKENGTVVLTVADAAGKGISACLYALTVRSLLRTFAMIEEDIGVVMSKTNNQFCEDTGDTGMFVTALSARYDPNTHILSYFSAGHIPGYVRKAGGKLITLEHTGMALGLTSADSPYKSYSITLEKGDLLLMFTDGLIDVLNDKHERFSAERLETCLVEKNWMTAREVVDGLADELETFVGEAIREEEMTLLVMKVE